MAGILTLDIGRRHGRRRGLYFLALPYIITAPPVVNEHSIPTEACFNITTGVSQQKRLKVQGTSEGPGDSGGVHMGMKVCILLSVV